MPASYRSGPAELRPTGAVSAAGCAVASCPSCGVLQPFRVLLPNPEINREGRAGLLLRTYRRCSSCAAGGPWLLRPLLDEEQPAAAPEPEAPAAAARPQRFGRTRQLLPAPALLSRRQLLPVPEGPRLRLAAWAADAHRQPISRRAVIAAVTGANPVTVARHYRAAYGCEPQRASTSGPVRAYSWQELVAVFDALEAEAARAEAAR